jgi:hypothetical protein
MSRGAEQGIKRTPHLPGVAQAICNSSQPNAMSRAHPAALHGLALARPFFGGASFPPPMGSTCARSVVAAMRHGSFLAQAILAESPDLERRPPRPPASPAAARFPLASLVTAKQGSNAPQPISGATRGSCGPKLRLKTERPAPTACGFGVSAVCHALLYIAGYTRLQLEMLLF